MLLSLVNSTVVNVSEITIDFKTFSFLESRWNFNPGVADGLIQTFSFDVSEFSPYVATIIS